MQVLATTFRRTWRYLCYLLLPGFCLLLGYPTLPLPVQTSYVHAPEATDGGGSAVEVSNLDSLGSQSPRSNPTLGQFLRQNGFDYTGASLYGPRFGQRKLTFQAG